MRHDARPYDVYRALGTIGDVLYIGISLNAEQRIRQHRSTHADWIEFVDSVYVETVPSRQIALVREAYLIQKLRPEWNIAEYPYLAAEFMRNRENWSLVDVRAFPVTRLGSPFTPQVYAQPVGMVVNL